MCKCVKTILPVIRTHTAWAKSAEAHLAGSKVYDGIVDASPAVTALGGQFPCRRLVTGKDIEGERMGHGIDIADRFI